MFFIILFGAGLLACSSVNTITVEGGSVAVTKEYEETNRIDSIISPYTDSLKDEMLEVIAVAPKDFVKGRPNGVLNNWSADAVLSYHKNTEGINGPIMSLLNVGGLRNPISKGDVTIGDIYKLMPFDNMVVCVEMPMSSLTDIDYYLSVSGGEPISGVIYKNGKLQFTGEGEHASTYWIITSDYLMNGGDKMNFFEQRVRVINTNMLLRETFIEVAKQQKELDYSDDTRIFIER